MVPYSYLIGRGHDHDGRFIEVVEERLRQMLRPFLLEVEMDEAWYVKVNHDVRDAIKAGHLASAAALDKSNRGAASHRSQLTVHA